MIGDFIAELRKEKKMTQKDLGEILNVDAKKISKWEKNIIFPDAMLLNDIAEALGVSTKELLQGKRDSTSTSDMNVEESKIEIDKDIADNINGYVKHEKRKIIIAVSLIVSLILIITIIITTTILSSRSYYENKIYVARGENEDFRIEAKMIKSESNQNNILIINNMEYISDNVGTADEPLITNLTLSVVIDGETKYSNSQDFNTETPLQIAMTGKMLYFENFVISGEKIELMIDFKNQNEELINKNNEIITLSFNTTH